MGSHLFNVVTIISLCFFCDGYFVCNRLRNKNYRSLHASDSEEDNVGVFGGRESSPSTKLVVDLKPIVDLPTSKSLFELRAEYLRLEAEKEELIMSQSKIDEEKRRLDSIDNFIVKLLESNNSLDNLVANNKPCIRKELFLRIIELANAAANEKERLRFLDLYDMLLDSVDRQDSSLMMEVTSEIKKMIQSEQKAIQKKIYSSAVRSPEVESTVQIYNQAMQQWLQANTTIGSDGLNLSPEIMQNLTMMLGSNSSQSLRTLRFPASLPITMLPLLLRGSELSPTDLETLKSNVFTNDLLNNTIVDYSTFLATFRGTPLMSVADVLRVANERIGAEPGLMDRVRLLALPDYQTMNPIARSEKYSGSKLDPIFTIIARDAKPQPNSVFEYIGGTVVLIASFVTVFLYAVDTNSLNADFLAKAAVADTSIIDRVLPIVGGVFALQLLHDLGHFIGAKIHSLELGLPLPLPSLQIGIFGSATRFLNYPKDRKALFDMAILGPLLGFLGSFACLFFGLMTSTTATAAEIAQYPALPVGFFSSSLLLYSMLDVTAHISSITDQTTLIPIHPLVAVGITGLLANALNFMPIGRLDGGRVTMAIGGRQAASSVSLATLFLQGLSLVGSPSVIALFWIILVALFQRSPDIPPEDDITPVATEEDDNRKGPVWFGRALALALCVLATGGTLVPVPTQPAMEQVAQTQAQVVEGIGGIPGFGNSKHPPTI